MLVKISNYILPWPKPGPLPKNRIEQCFPFQDVGADYTGPTFFRSITMKDLTAYILAMLRAVYLELVPKVTTSKFIRCLKKLIARRRRNINYPDNAKTFKTGANMLQKINKDKK